MRKNRRNGLTNSFSATKKNVFAYLRLLATIGLDEFRTCRAEMRPVGQ